MEMAWIDFIDDGRSASGKTRRWRVVPRGRGTTLGDVHWFGKWRRYVFSPRPQTVYDERCLLDIATFCRDQTEAHKAGREEAKA